MEILTGKVDKVHDARLLAFALVSLNELIERDGDDRVSAAACRVHVRRRHRTTCCTYTRRHRTQSIGCPHSIAPTSPKLQESRTTHRDTLCCSIIGLLRCPPCMFSWT